MHASLSTYKRRQSTSQMRILVFVLFTAVLLLGTTALAQEESLGPGDNVASARLSAKEFREIVKVVEGTAYDTAESWRKELRLRQVDLGRSAGLIVQGSDLLCGGTGNCQTWIFRKFKDRWVPMFAGEQAPLAERFQLGPSTTRGIKDLTILTNSSGEASVRVAYKFDGMLYRSK
jgi:hypothetical protein